MTRPDVTLEGKTGDSLRAAVRELAGMLDDKVVNLTQLGKVVARLAQHLLGAVEESGLSSQRFRAVAKALDLKTPKSSLAAFLEESNVPLDTVKQRKDEPCP
jgi:hypothetical protein